MIMSSVNARAKVELCNPETGEYRIILQGTLDKDETKFEKQIESLEIKLQRKHEVLSELMEEHIRLKKDLGEL